MSPVETIRRRRAIRTHRQAQASTLALLDAAAEFRRRAQEEEHAGRPELAAPFLDEAEMFETAARRPLGL